MKKRFKIIANFGMYSLFCYSSLSQSFTATNCFATFKAAGDRYKLQNNPNSAKQQYLYARNCNYLTNVQRVQIDSLIADINRKQRPTQIKQPTIKRNK